MSRRSRVGLLSHDSEVHSRSISPVDGAMRNKYRDIELSELRNFTPSKQRNKHTHNNQDVISTRVDSSLNDVGFGSNTYNNRDTTNIAAGGTINNKRRPREIMVPLDDSDYTRDYKDYRDNPDNGPANGSTVSEDPWCTSRDGLHSGLSSHYSELSGVRDNQPRSSASDARSVLSLPQSAKTSTSFRSSSVELDVSLSPESRLSEQEEESGLSTADEAEKDELNIYCVDHMTLISQAEARDSHGSCDNVVPAHEWAEAQTMERTRLNVEQELQRYDKFAARMIEERNEFKENLENEKVDVTDTFLDVMEDVIAFLLKKQKQFMKQLDKLHERQMDTIDGQIKRCKKVQQETYTHLNKLAECSPKSADFKKLKKTIQAKCPVYEEILRRDFNASLRLKYEFRQDPWVEKLFDQLTVLGEVKLHPRPSKLPGFLSEGKQTDYGERTIGAMLHNDATCDGEENQCCFSGATFISGGRAVLADWNNACLKVFKGKGVLDQKVPLSNNPWDVKHMGADKIVVTVPGEQKVYIISVTDKQLALESQFETDCECWAVVPVGDKLAMTCDPWSKTPSVKMYSQAGKLLSFYQKDTSGQYLFSYPEHITTDIFQQTLYISDGRMNIVIALTLEGCVLFRYGNKRLETPAGVTTDNQGYLYVCGRESGNIHQVSKTGQLVRILIDQPLLQNPRAIHFDPAIDGFLITDSSEDNCDDFFTVQWE